MTEEEVERQLSRLFHTAVGDPPQPVTLGGIRHLIVMRRTVAAISATIAIVLASCVGLVVSANAAGPAPASGHRQTAGPPAYYFQQIYGRGLREVIRSTPTGAVTGTVRCPWAGSEFFTLVVAGPGNFFMSCVKYVPGSQRRKVIGTRLYSFGLTRSGRPKGYVPVKGGNLRGLYPGGLAVSEDGSVLAANFSTNLNGAKPGVMVITTSTGAHAVWRYRGFPDGLIFSADDLSLSRDGQELAIAGARYCPEGGHACHSSGPAMYEVSHATKGGDLGTGRLVYKQAQVTSSPDGQFINSYLSPDGRTAITSVVSGDGRPGSGYVSVVLVSASTGKPIRTLYKLPTGKSFFYWFVTMDPTGKYILFNAGPNGENTRNGWIDNGKLVPLKPAIGTKVAYEAW
jgi:hypothetical protein